MNADLSQKAHALDPHHTLHALQTDAGHGLAAAEAEKRLQQYGANSLQQAAGRSPWRILLEQFTNVMILVASAIPSGLLGELADTVAIAAILSGGCALVIYLAVEAEKWLNAKGLLYNR